MTDVLLTNEILDPRAFRRRFALAVFDDGGIAVDLINGNYSRLNSSAAFLLEELERASSTGEACRAAAARLGIPSSVAQQEVEGLVRQLYEIKENDDPVGPFRYLPSNDGGYELWDSEQAVLHTDKEGKRLTLHAHSTPLPFRIFDYVSEIVPKMLFLHGLTVVHGSSSHRGGSAIGMSGSSRAGKTTTARTLAKHGYQLISEDLLILGRDLKRPRVCVGAEASVHQRIRQIARQLTEGRELSVDTSDLRDAATGPQIDLAALWFLDAERRGGTFQLNRLTNPDALSLLMTNGFLGSAGGENWRRYLATGRAIIAAVESYRPDLPKGLDALDAAIMAYSTNWAS